MKDKNIHFNDKGIDTKIDARNLNNFDFIRFLGALFVIIVHSYVLSGNSNILPFYIFRTGVSFLYIFFMISGYLILKSWDNSNSVLEFFWRRFLRLIPGLIVVTLIIMFIIGPLVTDLPLNEYFSRKQTWEYFRITTIFYRKDTLPGVFRANYLRNMTNGSIWSIPFEVLFYVVIAVLGLILSLSYKKRIILIINLGLMIVYYSIVFYNGKVNLSIVPFSIYFTTGALYYLYRDHIKFNYKIALVFLVILSFLLFIKGIVYVLVAIFLLPYVVFCFIFLPNKILNNFGKYGDFSYGMFIYSFPIQQTLAYYYKNISVIAMILFSFGISLSCAVLSWYLIESQALKLKNIDFVSKFRKMKCKK